MENEPALAIVPDAPKRISELEAKRLQVLDLKGRILALEAADIASAAREARDAYLAEFNAVCAKLGTDPDKTSVDFETGEVKVG